MPNKFYLKGVRKERAIVNKARSEGKIAFRSAGSHSPIDVCIIEPGKIRFIQCKPDSMSEKNKNDLRDRYQFLNSQFDVSFEVV